MIWPEAGRALPHRFGGATGPIGIVGLPVNAALADSPQHIAYAWQASGLVAAGPEAGPDQSAGALGINLGYLDHDYGARGFAMTAEALAPAIVGGQAGIGAFRPHGGQDAKAIYPESCGRLG